MNLGINGLGPNINSVNSSAAELRELNSQIADLKSDLTNLTDELMAGQSTSGTKQSDASQQQGNLSQTQQSQTQQTSSDYIPNEAIAVAADEDDKKLKKKRKKSSLDEKMEMLMALEELVDGAVLEDPDDQAAIDQFFTNMNQIRNLRGRLKGLEEKERRLKDQLEDMESDTSPSDSLQVPVQSESSSIPPSSTQSNIPPHINFSSPTNDQ